METGALRRGIGLFALYIGVFVAIVLIQFSKGPGFSQRVGGLSVTATYPKAERGKASAPEKVRISYAGMTIELAESAGAELVGVGGAAKSLKPLFVEAVPGGAKVGLSAGVELLATVESDGRERFTLSAGLPSSTSASSLRLSLSSRSAVPYVSGGKLVLSSGANVFDVALSLANLDRDRGRIVLDASAQGLGSLTISRAVKIASKPARQQETTVAREAVDASAFAALIKPWKDKAWAGLSSARLDTAALVWKNPDGTASFSEKALAAYFAESLERGSFAAAYEIGKDAKKKWPEKLGSLSAPYIGGLMPRMRAQESADAAELARIAQLASSGSPALCEKEGLIRFVLDRAPREQSDAVLASLAALDIPSLTLRQAVGLLGCVSESLELIDAAANPLSNRSAAAERIAAATRAVPEGFFLVAAEDGSCDLRLSALAGRYLVAYGERAGRKDMVGIGQGLIAGAAALADDWGFAPGRLTLRSGAIEQRMGSLSPEELYPIIADNPYYPREISFYREAGRGVWAWTCAPAVTYRKDEALVVFAAKFPAESSHYMALYGIEPFSTIQLYGIDYSADRQFEIYNASGYVFEAGRKALYLKMKHKRETEDVRLFYRRAEN